MSGFRGGSRGRSSRPTSAIEDDDDFLYDEDQRQGQSTSESPPFSESPTLPGASTSMMTRFRGLNFNQIIAPQVVEEVKEEKSQQGTSGQTINLISNYFRVITSPDWNLFQYKVDFNPVEDDFRARKGLLRSLKEVLRSYIYDGSSMLYTPNKLPDDSDDEPGVTTFVVKNRRDDGESVITLRFMDKTKYTDPVYMTFYNTIVRKCLYGLGLEEIGRQFCDTKNTIKFPALNLELYPGFMTSMQRHSHDLLLGVEIIHKVVRTESILQHIMVQETEYRGPRENFIKDINNKFKDAIVITKYNNLTYKFVEMDFSVNPKSTFLGRKGVPVSYLDYYKKYDCKIEDLDQPLILATPIKKPLKFKKLENSDANAPVVLIPELCNFTGLTDQMRQNNSLMRTLSESLHMAPIPRIKKINEFMAKLIEKEELVEELLNWGLTLETDLVRCSGRVLPKEEILFNEDITEIPNDQVDWTKAFRSKKLRKTCAPMDNWIVISTKRDAPQIDNLVKTMQKVSVPLGFKIGLPTKLFVMDPKAQTYVRAIDENVRRSDFQMVFIVLATNNPHTYAAIKKRVVVDHGFPSQCFLSKNLTSKGLMSIATKLAVQMCTKLGGEPWTVKFPVKGLMVAGFVSYKNVTSVVANLNHEFTRYFSTATVASSRTEISKNLCSDMSKCLAVYSEQNGNLPSRIIVYREGQLDYVADVNSLEIDRMLDAINAYYDGATHERPTLTYLMVSKRTNTRVFVEKSNENYENPPPGTIVDDFITLKNKYQFFLISSTARQGSVAPCCYVIMYDSSNLDADKLQKLTYKLCHMYFNWSGTVSVPAPLQYANKLSQMTVLAYDMKKCHPSLSNYLYYL